MNEAAEVLKSENVMLGMFASSKEKALEKMINTLYQNGVLTDKAAFTEDVLNRERVSSTGIGNGIAIPHGKSAHVKETAVAVARLVIPIKWEEDEDEPVKFIVLLAVNENDKGNTHVRLLSQMARKLASEEVCRRLTDAVDSEEIVKIFSE